MLSMSWFEKAMHLHIRCYLSRRKSAMKTVTQQSGCRAPALIFEHSFYRLSTNSPCSAAKFLKFGHLFSTERERRRRWPWPDAVCIRAKCPSCRFKIFSAKRTLTSSKRETHPQSVGGRFSASAPFLCACTFLMAVDGWTRSMILWFRHL